MNLLRLLWDIFLLRFLDPMPSRLPELDHHENLLFRMVYHPT